MLAKDCLDKRCGKRRGVTMLEILAVVAVISVLVALNFVLFSSSRKAVENMQVEAARARFPKAVARRTPPLSWRENEYIVQFKAGTKDPAKQSQRLAKLCQGAVIKDYSGAFAGCALAIADGTYDALMGDPVVSVVEHNYYVHLCGETVPTGVRRINVNLGPAGGSGSFSPIRNVIPNNPGATTFPVIAIMDSGVDASHPDLNVVFSTSFGLPTPQDQNGHGTHCAGIAAARHNDIGVAGVAPGAPIWNLRCFDINGTATAADVLSALQFAAANANTVKVVSMSFGFQAVVSSINLAVDYCVSQGQVCCVAAGNSAADSSFSSPASAPSAICVAALADSDGGPGGVGPVTTAGPDDTFADFSNWGFPVAVIAPGVQILSTFPVTGGVLGTNYGAISGTSMACPHVAGLAARIIGGANSKIRNIIPSAGPTLTPAQVLHIILQTSTENIQGIYDNRTYPLINAKGI
jgi:subtilisin